MSDDALAALRAGHSVVLCVDCHCYAVVLGVSLAAHYPTDPRVPCRGSGKRADAAMAEAAR